MRSVLLAVALLLAVVPGARAEDVEEPREAVVAEWAPAAVVAEAPEQPVMVLRQVQVPEQRAETAVLAEEQDMPRRGSFWWLVGVIVVAGLVLALVLD